MITINLRDYYPWCKEDIFVEITEEVLEAMKAADRQEAAYKRRMYYHKAQYSLDCHDGIENDVLHHSPSPEEIYISEEATKELFAAIGQLTAIQQRRLIAYYFEGMNFSQIADAEGVSPGSVEQSVKAALKKLFPLGHCPNAPDKMRLHQPMIDLVNKFASAGKLVAAICHGPQLLISAGLVKGRRMTSWPSVAVDLKNAGATYIDEPVVTDGKIITSRKPDDIPQFVKAVIESLEKVPAMAKTG